MGPRPMFGTRRKLANGKLGEYVWKSFDQVHELAGNLARAFLTMDLLADIKSEGYRTRAMGIFCKTREEWMITWIALWYCGGCIVPLYDTLGEESTEWIIQQTELKAIAVASQHISRLLKLKKEGRIPTLKHVIALDEMKPADIAEVEAAGMKVIKYLDCAEAGKKSGLVLKPVVNPESLATICYTSGTTSRPKGVMLTHKNYVAMSDGIMKLPFVKPGPQQTCICWLPLAHVFEQFTAVVMIAMGIRNGFYSGDVATIVDDLQLLKPQYFGSVPRVFNRVYEKVTNETSKMTGFKKYLYNKAVAAKVSRLRTTGCFTHFLYDKLVFKKIRNMLGGNISLIFVGGAPVSAEVQEMCRVWLSCSIVQGYGQTETSGPVIAQQDYDTVPGSIGAPMPQTEAKIVDVPEMNYYSTDKTDGLDTPRGEVWVRSPTVSLGYWRAPEQTKEAFAEGGWTRTGDIVKMLPSGHLTIIDRKKNIFKLCQGEYIAPDKLENIYQRCVYVAQIFVTGDSYKTFLVAVVVPRADTLASWAKEHNVQATYEELCKNTEVKAAIIKDLEALGRESKVIQWNT